MAIGLTLALIFSSMGNVFAYPFEGTNYDGIQVNDTFYSLGYITGNEAAFGDTFGPANSSEVILDFNQKAAKFSDYLSANPADFDAWASNAANQTPASPEKFMKADGTLVDIECDEPELTVVDVDVLNSTTIRVEFSDGTIEDFTVDEMGAGSNTVEFEYEGITYEETVTYTPPTPTQVRVERVLFDDYRHFQVLFNGKVDLESAEEAENYYFFINEGTADYGAVLPPSNQLDTIGVEIEAENVGDRTVVDIYLPEDARFTNEADFLPQFISWDLANEYIQQIPWYSLWTGPFGFDEQAWADDEESILVNMANNVHGVQPNFDVLTKGKEVEVAIRNIRDEDGERTIDTAVKAMVIKDEDRPEWIDVFQIDREEHGCHDRDKLASSAIQELEIYTDYSQNIRLAFDEPVFNTHGLGVDDINNHGHFNVEVAVDDQKIASTNDQNLGGILDFYMDADDDYEQASFVDLNIKRAIERLYTDGYRGDTTYNIKITGITDLAGNITDPQVLEFDVSLIDPSGDEPIVIDPPEILDVVQIHDNVFRVYMNRPDVKGTFEIRNGDGDDGLIEVDIDDLDAYKVEDELVWYKDVYVPAVDNEISIGINVKNDQLLAYDHQNTLLRVLRVFDVESKWGHMDGDSYECTFTGDNPFTIKKDIYAPVVVEPDEIEYDDRGSKIFLDVKDVVPNTWEEVGQPVYAMLYDYHVEEEFNNLPYGVFDFNSIDTITTESYNMGGNANPNIFPGFDLLPIIVSYTVDGVTRTAVVSNKCLLNEFANIPGESGRHYGAPGSIWYDFEEQQLVIDLAPGGFEPLWYNDLLDDEGKLVAGAEYTIEIPDGYFADQARFNAYDFDDWDDNEVDTEFAAWFVPDYDDGTFDYSKVLYVSDGRNNNSIARDDRPYDYSDLIGTGDESYMVHGYKYVEDPVTQEVEAAPNEEPDPDDAVPQTSKELINWFEDRNEIWVEFTGGEIDLDTLTDPENYVLDDRTLGDMGMTSDDIDYVESGENEWAGEEGDDIRKFARIKLPYDTISVDGDYLFEVSGVANEAGGTMTPVEVRLDINENLRPFIKNAIVIGEHEIELTFNEPVRYTADPSLDPENLGVAAKDNFVVYIDGNEYTPMTATVGTTPLGENDNPDPTYPLNKVVRLYLGSIDLLEDGLEITVEVIENESNGDILMEDDNCNPLNHEYGEVTVR